MVERANDRKNKTFRNLSENSLGYNNLIFVATILAEMETYDESETSLADFSGRTFMILEGSANMQILQKYPEIIVRTTTSIPMALNQVAEEAVNGALIARVFAKSFVGDPKKGVPSGLGTCGDARMSQAARHSADSSWGINPVRVTYRDMSSRLMTSFTKGIVIPSPTIRK